MNGTIIADNAKTIMINNIHFDFLVIIITQNTQNLYDVMKFPSSLILFKKSLTRNICVPVSL